MIADDVSLEVIRMRAEHAPVLHTTRELPLRKESLVLGIKQMIWQRVLPLAPSPTDLNLTFVVSESFHLTQVQLTACVIY